MIDTHRTWLSRVEELFIRYGIKSVTMDVVARELGISKKTLYQFVRNKDELVRKVLKAHIEEEQLMGERCKNEADNAIEEIFQVIAYAQSDFSRIKTGVLYDLKKYHPEAWEMMRTHHNEHLMRNMRNNLERGIREGLYRSDFDPEVIARLHVADSFILLDEAWFPRSHFSLVSIFREYMLFYLHGIVSDRGRTLLQLKLS
ncbi:MAG: TetR/AcrR family transcriptional regulator [Saprospiraceae bacterium]